ncbi:hypothetical protein L6164_002313 [Bauhinia variegata]|uniref:Uncharacterized protein n=1 Tax=Bauhinia variegata TaxID=167791 RepID=A0ACB9PYC0_BAUVA|nr:hypothetical protein L6164_002313 [Bauhinia variegata]
MAGPIRPQFVLFGSSIVQLSFRHEGWGSILADLYARKADIILRGYAAWNSRRALQVLDQVFPKSLSEKTHVIFLTTPPFNEAKVLESFAIDSLGMVGRSNESCRIYSEACLELCREMEVKAIDLWTALQNRNDWLDACFVDGIHLSQEGNKIVAKEILKVLREANWEPSLHWKAMRAEFGEDSPYDSLCSDGKTTINVSEWSFLPNMEQD